MNKQARELPNVVLQKAEPDQLGQAYYEWKKNQIVFVGDCSNVDEDDLIHSILHETEHWMQYMYLSDSECRKYDIAYNICRINDIHPFLERINHFSGAGDALYQMCCRKVVPSILKKEIRKRWKENRAFILHGRR